MMQCPLCLSHSISEIAVQLQHISWCLNDRLSHSISEIAVQLQLPGCGVPLRTSHSISEIAMTMQLKIQNMYMRTTPSSYDISTQTSQSIYKTISHSSHRITAKNQKHK